MNTSARLGVWLFPPLLRKALGRRLPHWVLSGGSIAVRLNRKQMGDDNAKIVASFLTSQFEGQIVIDDFGFYARRHDAALIREERLTAGVYTHPELAHEFRARH